MPVRLFQVTALAAFFYASAGHAAISLVNYDGFVVVQSGNTWNFHHESPENTALKGGTVYGRGGASVSTSQPLTVGIRGVVPVGKGAVVDVVAKVPRANYARGLIRLAKVGGGLGGLAAGIAAEALLDYGIKKLEQTPDGRLVGYRDDPDVITSDGNGYEISLGAHDVPGIFGSRTAACAAAVAFGKTIDGRDRIANGCLWKYADDPAASWQDLYPKKISNPACPSGWFYSGSTCAKEAPLASLSEQELYDRIASDSGWPTSSALALQKMLEYPDTRKILTPYPDNGVTLIGPPFVEGKTSKSTDTVQLVPGTNTVASPGATQTQTGTRTSTTTTTHPMTYSGNSVTHSTVNNTTTNITNNTTNVTTTENNTEEIKDDEKPDECQKNPDRLGCQKVDFDTPEGEIPRKQIDVSWSPVDLGLGGGSCPAPVQLGPDRQFSYQATCDNLHIIKPLVIAVALFIGGMIIFGGRADQ